jgi:hypothetical protein
MKKEECFYCNMNIQVNPDAEKHIFNWHLSGHGESIEDDDEEITRLEAEFNMNCIGIQNPEWVRMLYGAKSEQDKTSVINLICLRVDKLVKEKTKPEDKITAGIEKLRRGYNSLQEYFGSEQRIPHNY